MNINNKVYLAWWNNGLDYEDKHIILIGVFNNKGLAQRACDNRINFVNTNWDVNIFPKQTTLIETVKIDKVR